MCIIFYLVLNKFYPASTTFNANIMQFSIIFGAFPLAWLTNIQKHTNFFSTLGIFFSGMHQNIQLNHAFEKHKY